MRAPTAGDQARRDRRFPSSVYSKGTEPDARFTLANERTFLAWIRTALALIAGGVALGALSLNLQPWFREVASLLLIATGVASPAQAWFGWMRTEKALRLRQPMPSPFLSAPLGIAVVVVGVLVGLAVLLR